MLSWLGACACSPSGPYVHKHTMVDPRGGDDCDGDASFFAAAAAAAAAVAAAAAAAATAAAVALLPLLVPRNYIGKAAAGCPGTCTAEFQRRWQ